MNLLKIKSVVTILLTTGLLGIVFLNKDVPDNIMALYTATYGAVITSLFAKRDTSE